MADPFEVCRPPWAALITLSSGGQLSSNYPWPLSYSIRKVKLGLFPTPNLPQYKSKVKKKTGLATVSKCF